MTFSLILFILVCAGLVSVGLHESHKKPAGT